MRISTRLSTLVSAIAIALFVFLGARIYRSGSMRIAEIEKDVDVVYALVPHSKLATAVVSRELALAIENTLFEENSGAIIKDYALITFVRTSSRYAPLHGRLVVSATGNAKAEYEIAIPSIGPGRDHVFVIDGGSLSYLPAGRAKTFKWLSLGAK